MPARTFGEEARQSLSWALTQRTSFADQRSRTHRFAIWIAGGGGLVARSPPIAAISSLSVVVASLSHSYGKAGFELATSSATFSACGQLRLEIGAAGLGATAAAVAVPRTHVTYSSEDSAHRAFSAGCRLRAARTARTSLAESARSTSSAISLRQMRRGSRAPDLSRCAGTGIGTLAAGDEREDRDAAYCRPAEKYVAIGCAKYRPTHVAVGYIA